MMATDADLVSLTLALERGAEEGGGRREEGEGKKGEGKKGFGREAHAVLLDAIRQVDPALSQEMHDGSGIRPYTVSDLIGYSPRRGLAAGRSYALRFTALTRPAAAALLAAANHGALAAGESIRLGDEVFRIQDQTSNLKPQNSNSNLLAQTYESLSAPWLLGRSAPSRRIALRFVSPVTFRSQEKHVPLPLPALVFGSLLEKWNAFAPVALPPETRRFAEECMALSGFELRSRPAYLKEGSVRVGAVGWARYTALNNDRYWLSVMNLLADFAPFAGVGAGTTMGLGGCGRVNDER